MMKYLTFIVILYLFGSCKQDRKLFNKLPATSTGISFNNIVTESDSINPLDMEYLYNGGGVAVGDFNKDGKPDLYFTASQAGNKLYLNRGGLSFDDVTKVAGVEGANRWSNAASVVDINNDGWDDIYVCTSIQANPQNRRNLFYINEGTNTEGIPVFKERAMELNLADTGFSVNAAFFDYDLDGDLDMYLVTTTLARRNSTRFDGGSEDNRQALSDKLFRNDGSQFNGIPKFSDVSKHAGISDQGYGLGISVTDINKDGYKDLYITNDFFSSDILYINNRNGTFTNKINTAFKHTSQNAMGVDVADINNDNLDDVVVVDMNPEDNFRKKTNMSGGNYFVYQSMAYGNGSIQYVRNTLQLNNGMMEDSSGQMIPVFSDIAFLAGMAETDWSWTPSIADFDNDGFKDLIITNGYPKDVTDHDFGVYRSQAYLSSTKKQLLDQIPQIKIPNYAFRNSGNLRFANVTAHWGMDQAAFSTGAIYADLDNDGDLEYIINNINDEAFVYENLSNEKTKNKFLKISFNGPSSNINGIGAVAELYTSVGVQRFENSPYRGYLSTVPCELHFGLGTTGIVDSMKISWPDGKIQVLKNVRANQTLVVDYKSAGAINNNDVRPKKYFQDITDQSGVDHTHIEFDYIDFNHQKLLPHKLSQYGPPVAVADLNGDNLDDIFIGASLGYDPFLYIQTKTGTFFKKSLPVTEGSEMRKPETMGVVLFDADNDGDIDIYAGSGSIESTPGTKSYQDQFYINDGSGNFTLNFAAIPESSTSTSCVKAADYDQDGDLDLFIGVRVTPGRYPEPASSFIYRNDSDNGVPKFTNVSGEIAKALSNIGLVCDALWTDFDNDGDPDLMLAGEWMSLKLLKNNDGTFADVSDSSGLGTEVGWWNALTAGDFDNDGDIDYVAGNLGLNSFYRGSQTEPVAIYARDFDGDQAYDAIPALFLKGKDGVRREYPANVRDEMIKQMISTKKKFPKYRNYAEAGVAEILSAEQLQNALVLKATNLSSSYVQNNGNGKFELKPLPTLAQLAPLYGMVAEDINEDEYLDLVCVGNEYGSEVANGRYDAFNGLVLFGNGDGTFRSANFTETGFYVPFDGKGLAKIEVNKQMAFIASQNRNKLKLFAHSREGEFTRVPADISGGVLKLKGGKNRKLEFYYGSSFLSQSSRFVFANGASVEFHK